MTCSVPSSIPSVFSYWRCMMQRSLQCWRRCQCGVWRKADCWKSWWCWAAQCRITWQSQEYCCCYHHTPKYTHTHTHTHTHTPLNGEIKETKSFLHTTAIIGLLQWSSVGDPQAAPGPLASYLWPLNCYSFTMCCGWVSTCIPRLVSMPTIHRQLGHSLLPVQFLTFTFVFGAVRKLTFCQL